MKPIIVTLASVILLAGCSASYQAGNQSNNQASDQDVAIPYGTTTAKKNITTIKGYRPTQEDVTRYKNDIVAFLNASVPNFHRFNKAMILIDDVQADSLSEVSLDDVHLISVLDDTSAVMLGTVASYGVIIIRTK